MRNVISCPEIFVNETPGRENERRVLGVRKPYATAAVLESSAL